MCTMTSRFSVGDRRPKIPHPVAIVALPRTHRSRTYWIICHLSTFDHVVPLNTLTTICLIIRGNACGFMWLFCRVELCGKLQRRSSSILGKRDPPGEWFRDAIGKV
ncbi:uncharacterized protein LOC114882786 [Osmia bicornis bicornis]|uniref:uncharacterized protein LOC114882786 n=1 Tax=Osmia bicornis bicornis TaxID=1437191 RepID=UPI0010F82362|nr:uncharacterized protein LOC114882786 [Osmia bicornis bicornis]